MKSTLIPALAIIMAVTISNASAQIKPRATNQHHRIKQGLRSGELTRAEAKNLREGQKDIRQDIKEAKTDDGIITKEERKEIKQEQRQESRKIFRKKHNKRDRD
jgi:methylthioribose-1-phosphate isomerase